MTTLLVKSKKIYEIMTNHLSEIIHNPATDIFDNDENFLKKKFQEIFIKKNC